MHDITTRKPKPFLFRELTVNNIGDLFASFAKLTWNTVTGNWVEAGSNVVDGFRTIQLKELDMNEAAWLLVQLSLYNACSTIIKGSPEYFTQQPNDMENVGSIIEDALGDHPITITSKLYKAPRKLEILGPICDAFEEMLRQRGLEKHAATTLCSRLPRAFALAVHEEWSRAPHAFKALQDYDGMPSREAFERELAWKKYEAYLQSLPNERLFLDDFSWEQVYIPLRGGIDRTKNTAASRSGHRARASEERSATDRTDMNVVDLEQQVLDWLHSNGSEPILILKGGPGSGKSTFAKHFAAHVAESFPNEWRTVFLPLISFNIKDDLMAALDANAEDDRFPMPSNPLKNIGPKDKVLLIFDGLDELSHSGESGMAAAQQFVKHVRDRFTGDQNGKNLKILITGRDLAVTEQEHLFRAPGQIISVLPYFLPQQDEARHIQYQGKLAQIDQRPVWWEAYGKAKGGIPHDNACTTACASLPELSCHPLLNYLLAVHFDANGWKCEKVENSNTVYASILTHVYERSWGNKENPILEAAQLEEWEFQDLLKEIAIAAWHAGDARKARQADIERRLGHTSLQEKWESMRAAKKSGLNPLLMAFFFQPVGGGHDGTVEFTHKTFGEYLAALYLVDLLEEFHEAAKPRKEKKRSKRPVTAEELLVRWCNLCGPAPLGSDSIFPFLRNEIRLLSDEQCRDYQNVCVQLLQEAADNDFPMTQLKDRNLSFKEMLAQSANALEALLAAHSLLAKRTDTLAEIEWSDDKTFGEWISRKQMRSPQGPCPLIVDCLNHIQAEQQVLSGSNLGRANLERANLRGANLIKAILPQANLTEANLNEASLLAADLTNAVLARADLTRTTFMRANLTRANLLQTDLRRAGLMRANLTEANLTEAKLSGADLTKADLTGANFTRANLAGANLRRTDLTNANLRGADLTSVDLTKKQLNSAITDETTILP